MRERRVWFNWQNLTKGDRGATFPIEGRAWLHLFEWVLRFEWNLWSRFCHLSTDFDDEGTTISVAVPPVSLWFGIQPVWGSRFRRFLAPMHDREFNLGIHHWAIWLKLGGDMHRRRADPWWRRGVCFHIDDFILGRARHSKIETQPVERIVIDLDGHQYHGTAKFERATWKRPRWFAKVRDSVWISMDPGHGLPHSGKGENSWDCGDDALCGWGVEGDDVQACIRDGIERVEKYRKRYGAPSRYGPAVLEVA